MDVNQYTSFYDMHKNKWIALFSNIKLTKNYGDIFINEPLLWTESNPYVLYCASNQYYAYFDVRANNEKWKQITDDNFITKVSAKYIFI